MNATTTRPAGHPKKFECPNCGDSVSLLAHGHSITVTCPSCSSVLDVNNPQVKLLQAYNEQQRGANPAIAIGSKGVLAGETWQVVGFLVKKSTTYNYAWREYLLFNPYLGYRFLSEFKGHWTLFEVLPIIPSPKQKRSTAVSLDVEGDSRAFKLYEKTQAEVAFVMGEFYWRVREGDASHIRDFIAPPFGLSEELEGEGKSAEVNWSVGKYLEPAEVKAAFAEAKLPSRIGAGIHQPNPNKGLSRLVLLVGFISFLLLTGKHVLDSNAQKLVMEPQVISLASTSDSLQHTETRTFNAFTLAEPAKAVELRFQPTLQHENTEVEAEGALVNVTTGETFPAFLWAYYATGVDSDGAWSEHGDSGDMMFYDLSAGEYKLTYAFKAKMHPVNGFRADLRLAATQNPVSMTNYMVALLLMVIVGFVIRSRERSFEKERWSESDYSPYASSDEE